MGTQPSNTPHHGCQRRFWYWTRMGAKQGSRRRAPPKEGARLGEKGETRHKGQACPRCYSRVCGFAPYEKRAMELLAQGFDKRALKFCKKRLGTHRRGKKKRSELEGVLQAQKLKK